MRHRFLLTAVGVMAALALAACQGKVQRPACPTGETCLEYGNNTEPLTLDPGKANLIDEASVISDLIMGLTTDDPGGDPVPGVAERWETSADGLTWTFHLRDSKWSDGTPVTADDFVYGLRRTLDPKTASIYAYLLYVLKNGQAVNEGKAPLSALGVYATDPHTLVMTLVHPAPYLPELTKHQSFYPVPRHVVEKLGDAWVRPGAYVSNGPFKLVGWKLGDHIEVRKNPYFYDANNVCLDRINYYPTPDAVAAERRMARGELDLNSNFQSNRIDRIRKAMPGVARPHMSLATAYLSFNTKLVKPLKDVRVRRALSMAIDRDFITTKLLRAGQVPAYSFTPPGTAGGAEGARLSWAGLALAQRQAQARDLLKAAGYGPDHPLSLSIKIGGQTDTILITQAIQADWAAIGVKAKIEQNEGQIAFAAYRNRDYDVGAMSWYADFNDPVTFLGLLKSDTGAQNYGDYNNPAYDALLNQADNEPDPAARGKILRQAEQLMLDEEALAPIYFLVNRNLVSPKVTGWEANQTNFHRTRWMCLTK